MTSTGIYCLLYPRRSPLSTVRRKAQKYQDEGLLGNRQAHCCDRSTRCLHRILGNSEGPHASFWTDGRSRSRRIVEIKHKWSSTSVRFFFDCDAQATTIGRSILVPVHSSRRSARSHENRNATQPDDDRSNASHRSSQVIPDSSQLWRDGSTSRSTNAAKCPA